jgi:hypothetical protein
VHLVAKLNIELLLRMSVNNYTILNILFIFYLNLICVVLTTLPVFRLYIYLQMVARLVTNEIERCGKKDNGIILGFIL